MNYAFHSEAEAEFKHAIDYYESCAEGLGYDFAVEVYSQPFSKSLLVQKPG